MLADMLKEIAKEKLLIKQIREKCNKTSQPGVSIIVPTNKLTYIDNIFMNYARSVYPNTELIIILNNNSLNINDYRLRAIGLKDIRIFQLEKSCTLGECLNFGIEQSKYDYISKMDDDDYYGPNYLIDLMNVFKYTDAQVTGKASAFVYFEDNYTLAIRQPKNEYKYTPFVVGGTILLKKEVFEKVKFRNMSIAEDLYFSLDCNSAGIKIYSSDKYNHIYMRHKNIREHTWQVIGQLDAKKIKKLLITRNLIPFIIV